VKRTPVAAALGLLAALSCGAQSVDLEPAREAIRRQQFQDAIGILRPAADAGDPEAAFILAQLLRAGRGGTRDVAAACALLESAAAAGHGKSAGSLAAMLDSKECSGSARTPAEWRAVQAASGAGAPVAVMASREPDDAPAEFLFRAAREGDIEALRRLLASIPAGAADEFGRNALMIAAEAGREDAVRELIARGAPLDAADRNGDTALTIAVRGNRAPTALLLIDSGAAVNVANALGVTPLMLAARADGGLLVERLLAAGAAPEARDAEGLRAGEHAALAGHSALAARLGAAQPPAGLRPGPQPPQHASATPVLDAAEAGDVDRLRRAIAAGQGVNDANRNGLTALALAARGGHAEAVSLLLEQSADPGRPDASGRTPLAFAAMADDPDSARLLLAAGARGDATDERGRSALWHAAASNSARAAAALARPPQLELPDADGVTPLMAAASRGHTAVVRVLLGAGADVGRSSRTGNDPLRAAAAAGRAEVIALLLSAGARPDTANAAGDTALHLAVQSRCAACVRDLLAAGASTRLRNAGGLTAADVARRTESTEIIRLLQ
jgi:ankyrin repeat protein